MDKDRALLINIIAGKTGWGPVSEWQGGDFRRLSQMIFDQTRVNISESTLRRLFGKSDYPHLPNETTLDTLAVFAGYAGWRDFRSQQNQQPGGKPLIGKKTVFVILGALVLLLVCAGFYLFRGSEKVDNSSYIFTSRPVTRTIPNTVIFHYKTAGQKLPIFIQQSWDARTRVKVAADGDTYASVYYRPGFYQAKLIVGNRIVREHPLIIPTAGWLGLIFRQPVPFYLKPAEFTQAGKLEVLPATYTAHGLKTEPAPLRAELYNVGNFTPVPVADADFTAMVKSDEDPAADACGTIQVFLVTNGIPVSMALCGKGCVATIGFFNGKGIVSGKTTDLSGFGVTPGLWAKTEIKSFAGKLQLLVNDHIAYQTSLPPASSKILGIAFGFDGGGAVKSIVLRKGDSTVFKDR